MNTAFEKTQRPGGWISATPVPTRTELHEFYAKLYYQDPQSTSYQTSYDDVALRYKQLKCDALLHAFAGHGIRGAGETFLDVGAGEGFLMDAASRRGLAVTGLDFSSYAVRKFFPSLEEKLVVGDVFESLERLAAGSAAFRACSAVNVLEHVVDPEQLLASIRRILAPGGVCAITVPNDFSRLQALLIEQQSIDREFWWAPPQHLHYFNAENLPPFCAEHGYVVVDAFSDFPIDLFLLHPGSNYVKDPAQGPAAHRARMLHDLLVSEAGLDAYLNYYRAMFQVGLGRDITVMLAASH